MNKKFKFASAFLSAGLLITPISGMLNQNNTAQAYKTYKNSIQKKDLEIFIKEFNNALHEDETIDKSIFYEERGIKSQLAKQAAKQMINKLYKIGSKSFDSAVKKAANKIPNESVRDAIINNVTYSKVSTALNILANAEGTITDGLTNIITGWGVPYWAATIISRAVVFILL